MGLGLGMVLASLLGWSTVIYDIYETIRAGFYRRRTHNGGRYHDGHHGHRDPVFLLLAPQVSALGRCKTDRSRSPIGADEGHLAEHQLSVEFQPSVGF